MESKKQIIELVKNVNNQDILHCIYIFISDIVEEDESAEKGGKNGEQN